MADDNGTLDGFPAEAVKYIKELRAEAAGYRSERNDIRAKYDDAGELLKVANDRLKDADEFKSTQEKFLSEHETLKEDYNRLFAVAKVGLTPEDRGRLVGKTPEELQADAKALSERLGKTTGPAKDGAAGDPPKDPKLDKLTEAFNKALGIAG